MAYGWLEMEWSFGMDFILQVITVEEMRDLTIRSSASANHSSSALDGFLSPPVSPRPAQTSPGIYRPIYRRALFVSILRDSANILAPQAL